MVCLQKEKETVSLLQTHGGLLFIKSTQAQSANKYARFNFTKLECVTQRRAVKRRKAFFKKRNIPKIEFRCNNNKKCFPGTIKALRDRVGQCIREKMRYKDGAPGFWIVLS